MAKALEVALDIYQSNSSPEEFDAYQSGMQTGLNLVERMIEQGAKRMPSWVFVFLGKHRESPISLGDLIKGIQIHSNTQVAAGSFIGADNLCTQFHANWMQGVLEGFGSTFPALAETYDQTGNWVEARRLTDKYIQRVRIYILEMSI